MEKKFEEENKSEDPKARALNLLCTLGLSWLGWGGLFFIPMEPRVPHLKLKLIPEITIFLKVYLPLV